MPCLCSQIEHVWRYHFSNVLCLSLVLTTLVILFSSLFFPYYVVIEAGTDHNVSKRTAGKSNILGYDDLEILEPDKRDILKDTHTSYISTNPSPNIRDETKRKSSLLSSLLGVNVNSSYDFVPEMLALEEFDNLLLNNDKSSKIQAETKTQTETNVQKEEIQRENIWKGKLKPEEVRRIQANTMKRYIDEATNPCDDFYQYACGNWAKYNKIPADKTSYDTFEMLRESLEAVLRDLLMERRTKRCGRDSSNDAIQKAKNLYRSCINTDLLRKRGDGPLLKLLQDLGGWPILDPNWQERQFDFTLLLAKLRLYNNDILISQWIGPDIINSDEYVIQIDQTSLGLPSREYFLEEENLKYVEAYKVYMTTIVTLLGAPLDNATKDVEDLISFETLLAEITAQPDVRKEVSAIYKRLTLVELTTFIPQFNWFRYFKIVLGRKVEPEEAIVCYCYEYLQNLVVLLSNTPSRIVANYLFWRFVRHRVNNLDSKFDNAKQRFYYVLFGREKSPPRWQVCVSQVNSNLGMALGSMFVSNYFDETSKNDTLQMTRDLHQAFKELLVNSDWLDEDTKEMARIKMDAMRLRIGYPDFILDLGQLNDRYKDITIHSDYYFENMLNILQHLTRVERNRLGTAVNKTLWNSAPAVVNAYYSRNKNQIMFPAGILQPPFYHRHFPRALNYGGIGIVIGHEITHGFDDKGRLFDKEGNLQRWWKDSAIEQFHQRAECLIEQYNTYAVPEINIPVDGVNTQGENIADNGGVKQAFRAYSHWLQKHPHAQETMPGLNITGKQLFFLNFAQVWCGTARPEAMRNKMKTAVHAPGRFRVIGTLSNSKDFAEVFLCPKGARMNPEVKCTVW